MAMNLHLTLGVESLEHSMNFYRDIPGLAPEWLHDPQKTARGVVIHTPTLSVVFIPLTAMEQQHPALLQHLSRERLGAGVQLEFSCPDLNTLSRIAKKRQWPILYELEDTEHQRRELWLQDPDGYLLIFNQESET